MQGSGIALTVGLLAGPLLGAIFRFGRLIRAETVLVLAPIYWLLSDIVQGYYPMVLVDHEDVNNTIIAIGLFAVFCHLGLLGRPWPIPKFLQNSIRTELSAGAIFLIAFLAFCFAILAYAIPSNFDFFAMVEALKNPRFAAPWTRGSLGGWDAFYDHMSYFGMILPSLAVIYGRKRENFLHPVVLIILLFSAIFLLFITQGGNRRYIGVSIGAAILTYILSAPRLGMAQLGILGAMLLSLLAYMQLVYLYRGTGFQDLFKDNELRSVNYLHVDDNFLRLAQTIHFIPDSHPFVYERWVVYIAVRPIPRVFWPDKPTSRGIFQLNEIVGIAGVGLSMSTIGELYLSMGFLAIAIGGWFYGRLAAMANGILIASEAPERFLLYAGACMAIFAGVRSMIDIVLMSYVLLAWVGLTLIYKNFFRSTQ